MKERKKIFLYSVALVGGILWAALISRYIELGPSQYGRNYRARTLCQEVKPGMSIQSVENAISSFGQARSTTFQGEHVVVEGTDGICIIELNPARAEVVKTSVSDLPIIN